MYKHVEKNKESKNRAVANSVAQKKGDRRRVSGILDYRPGSIIQLRIKPEKIKEYSHKLNILESSIMVVDIPENNPPDVTVKFGGYPEGHTFNLTEELKSKRCKDFTGGNYSDETSARVPIDVFGGAAYIESDKLSLINEGIDNYDRYLFHEIGHAVQHEMLGATVKNTSEKLLEWHNILFHENLFDPDNPRIAYNTEARVSAIYESRDQKAKADKNSDERDKIHKEMKKTILFKYNRLDKLIKEIGLEKNIKDFDIYSQVYNKFEEIVSEVDERDSDKVFLHQCMQINLLEELYFCFKGEV